MDIPEKLVTENVGVLELNFVEDKKAVRFACILQRNYYSLEEMENLPDTEIVSQLFRIIVPSTYALSV